MSKKYKIILCILLTIASIVCTLILGLTNITMLEPSIDLITIVAILLSHSTTIFSLIYLYFTWR